MVKFWYDILLTKGENMELNIDLANPDYEFDTAIKFDDGTIVWLRDGIIVDSNDMLSTEQINELLKRMKNESRT